MRGYEGRRVLWLSGSLIWHHGRLQTQETVSFPFYCPQLRQEMSSHTHTHTHLCSAYLYQVYPTKYLLYYFDWWILDSTFKGIGYPLILVNPQVCRRRCRRCSTNVHVWVWIQEVPSILNRMPLQSCTTIAPSCSAICGKKMHVLKIIQ